MSFLMQDIDPEILNQVRLSMQNSKNQKKKYVVNDYKNSLNIENKILFY